MIFFLRRWLKTHKFHKLFVKISLSYYEQLTSNACGMKRYFSFIFAMWTGNLSNSRETTRFHTIFTKWNKNHAFSPNAKQSSSQLVKWTIFHANFAERNEHFMPSSRAEKVPSRVGNLHASLVKCTYYCRSLHRMERLFHAIFKSWKGNFGFIKIRVYWGQFPGWVFGKLEGSCLFSKLLSVIFMISS